MMENRLSRKRHAQAKVGSAPPKDLSGSGLWVQKHEIQPVRTISKNTAVP